MIKLVRLFIFGWLTCCLCLSPALSEPLSLSPEIQKQIDAYQQLIKTHQYAQAITLMENTLKEANANSAEEPVLIQLKTLLDDAQRQNKVFSNMIKSLTGTKKQEICLDTQTIIIIDKANESGIEGCVKDNLKDKRKVSWIDMPLQNIYGLFTLSGTNVFDIAKLKGDDKFNLAVWCFNHSLPVQSETGLMAFYKEQPTKIALINQLLTRIRNIPLPQGGFALYNDTTWITAETAQKRAEILKKLGEYKGVLDKAGADKEKLTWEKAIEKETEHFIVKTNLSVDALNDICVLLECAYFTYQDIFGFDPPKEKLRVLISKNQDEYKKIFYDLTDTNPPSDTGGFFSPALSLINKLKQDHLLSYYNPAECQTSTRRWLHECTHYAMELERQKYRRTNRPMWLEEGWPTYYETSKLEGKRFVTNLINQRYLPRIKDDLNQKLHIQLENFINSSQKEYSLTSKLSSYRLYAQGWSLIYFLVNGKGGKYKTGLQAYMGAWEKGKIVTDNTCAPQDKPAHLKLFEECMGVPINQLEQEWKEYILQLK